MIVRGEAVDVLFERVVGMERLVGVKQSLRLDGKKVCNIKMVGILQAESNNINACALPSIHLPLTREARIWCFSRDSAFFKRVNVSAVALIRSRNY